MGKDNLGLETKCYFSKGLLWLFIKFDNSYLIMLIFVSCIIIVHRTTSMYTLTESSVSAHLISFLSHQSFIDGLSTLRPSKLSIYFTFAVQSFTRKRLHNYIHTTTWFSRLNHWAAFPEQLFDHLLNFIKQLIDLFLSVTVKIDKLRVATGHLLDCFKSRYFT